tara:strand:+ start:914 stop:1861 length:948 start_codon:yes stop_codon:yes gene_type:complete
VSKKKKSVVRGGRIRDYLKDLPTKEERIVRSRVVGEPKIVEAGITGAGKAASRILLNAAKRAMSLRKGQSKDFKTHSGKLKGKMVKRAEHFKKKNAPKPQKPLKEPTWHRYPDEIKEMRLRHSENVGKDWGKIKLDRAKKQAESTLGPNWKKDVARAKAAQKARRNRPRKMGKVIREEGKPTRYVIDSKPRPPVSKPKVNVRRTAGEVKSAKTAARGSQGAPPRTRYQKGVHPKTASIADPKIRAAVESGKFKPSSSALKDRHQLNYEWNIHTNPSQMIGKIQKLSDKKLMRSGHKSAWRERLRRGLPESGAWGK